MFKLNTIGGRLLTLPFAALLGLIILTLVALISFKNTLMHEKEQRVTAVIDLAAGVVAHYQSLEQDGTLSRTEAQKRAQEAIKSLRYDTTEYVWINDFTSPIPRMLMHPTVPSLDGTILDKPEFNYAILSRNKDGSQSQKLDNANIFTTFTQTVNNYGSGFVEYKWPKAIKGGGVTSERFKKLSYLASNPEWNWVIGSGIYIDDVSAQFWNLVKHLAVVGLIIVIAIVVLNMYIRRWVLQQLGGEVIEARLLVQKVSDGDFSGSYQKTDEPSDSIIGAVENMTRKLAKTVRSLGQISSNLSSSSSQLAVIAVEGNSTQDMQTQETDQIALAVNEMSNTIAQISTSAHQASELANKTDLEVINGRKAVQDTVASLNGLAGQISKASSVIYNLSENSRNVGGVLEVIQSIAEQTNLLALNAAIEAARAGEAGRGFAVVADEVRNLASRTQQSTEEIRNMIAQLQAGAEDAVKVMESSIQETQTTVVIAGKAEAALHLIAQAAEEIRDMNYSIASSSEEQAAAAEEINQNILALMRLCHESSDSTKQTQQASHELEQMAKELSKRISRFKVD